MNTHSMDGAPMIEEVSNELFRLELPLPANPLRAVNSYVFRERDLSLIVDPGLDHPHSLEALISSLERIGVNPARCDVFITHLHADHAGLGAKLASPGRSVYIGREDGEALERWRGWGDALPVAASNGIPLEELTRALTREPVFSYKVDAPPSYTLVEDGQRIRAGSRTLTAVATPGHTSGHRCLLDEGSREFLSGDHILMEISPILTGWEGWSEDPLAEYLESLEKVERLEISRVLPGHRASFDSHLERIGELREFHAARLSEALGVIGEERVTAYEAASRMSWDMRGVFREWPMAQRWFATGEALAHLRHLVNKGLARREVGPDGLARFSPA